MQIEWRGKKKYQDVMMGRPPEGLHKIKTETCYIDMSKVALDFTSNRMWDSGRFKLTRPLDLGCEAVSRSKAVYISREFMSSLAVPGEAVMEECIPVNLERTGEEAKIIAYTIAFVHRYRGCALAGDHVTLIVQNDGVKMVSGWWHNVNKIKGSYRPGRFTNTDLKGAFVALRRYYLGIQKLPDILYVRPVYFVMDKSTEPRVVWEVCFSPGQRIFWDSSAKRSPEHFKQLRKQL